MHDAELFRIGFHGCFAALAMADVWTVNSLIKAGGKKQGPSLCDLWMAARKQAGGDSTSFCFREGEAGKRKQGIGDADLPRGC